jgi:hypothetical protein
MTFWLNAGQTRAYLPATYKTFYYINLGSYNTDYEGLIDATVRLPINRLCEVSSLAPMMPSAASVDPDINFTLFGRTFLRSTTKHCNFAGDECWTVRVHPSINSTSASTGYVDGGQMLSIKGVGLSGRSI